MGTEESIRALRHISKGVMREYSRDHRVHEVIEDEHGVGAVHEDIRDHQFGHTSHIAGLIYGPDLMEAPMQTMNQQEGFKRVSIEWHRFMQFASAMEMDFPHPTIRGYEQVRVAPGIRHEQIRRWQVIQQMGVRLALRKIVGNEQAELRRLQQEVLEAIVARKSPIVNIMGTSIGKTVLFVLPAIMNSQE